jgi:hypothetical protein
MYPFRAAVDTPSDYSLERTKGTDAKKGDSVSVMLREQLAL